MDLDNHTKDDFPNGLKAWFPGRHRKGMRKMARLLVLAFILFLGTSLLLALLGLLVIFFLTYSELMLILQVSPTIHESKIPFRDK